MSRQLYSHQAWLAQQKRDWRFRFWYAVYGLWYWWQVKTISRSTRALADEFAAWEQASDEALMSFERQLNGCETCNASGAPSGIVGAEGDDRQDSATCPICQGLGGELRVL